MKWSFCPHFRQAVFARMYVVFSADFAVLGTAKLVDKDHSGLNNKGLCREEVCKKRSIGIDEVVNGLRWSGLGGQVILYRWSS